MGHAALSRGMSVLKAAVGAVSMGTAASALMWVWVSLEGFAKVITTKGFLAAVTALRHRLRLEIRL